MEKLRIIYVSTILSICFGLLAIAIYFIVNLVFLCVADKTVGHIENHVGLENNKAYVIYIYEGKNREKIMSQTSWSIYPPIYKIGEKVNVYYFGGRNVINPFFELFLSPLIPFLFLTFILILIIVLKRFVIKSKWLAIQKINRY